MRQKRAKNYRKLMHTYQLLFGFREPYQVLVDADFLKDLSQQKIDIQAALARTVQGAIKPMITQCCIRQLYSKSDELKQEIRIAKSFERRRCGHIDEALSPSECIQSVVNINGRNKHRYVVATQDPELRQALRSVPGVPLIYMKRSVVILEPASRATLLEKHNKESVQMGMSKEEKLLLSGKKRSANELAIDDQDTKESTDLAGTEDSAPKANKKRKGPKGPNPLSIKKRSSKNHTTDEPTLPVNIIGDVGERKKHRRKRK
ncbi:rRNA processing protein Utp23 [Schizosaccharomyces pombe]|uniref:rRNA-processing protein utp23 n=1 Tax=Schizosaccharomyces pombe (strain 972 / ATCC 24843) TaxID=284812 RepID=UTP23_SCHPO|nr:putative rRNA processing protein Utp23 [Schizosaccharomyces pombe]O74862.1 RecName: Full=rRNA-processing protein utp23; AltName: Full=U three protein 23 [Schizosaccharomyces pombe 972h-]CAA21426.1 rRNA processing protein Utp23 (predicted) [Schizosaccharomyces pombe]|eukprot:NP_588391.1 putative rRNA processing protein Utp23 [Schizosaccharomyces pombe]